MIEPSFLHQDVLANIDTNRLSREAAFCEVVDLKNIPDGIKDRVRSGMVLKKYKFSDPWNESYLANLFLYDNRYGASEVYDVMMLYTRARKQGVQRPSAQEILNLYGDHNDVSGKKIDLARVAEIIEAHQLPQIAKEVKERHRSIAEFFNLVLPGVVAETQFIVGEQSLAHGGRQLDFDPYVNFGRGTIASLYEVQPKYAPIIPLDQLPEQAVFDLIYDFSAFRHKRPDEAEYYTPKVREMAKVLADQFRTVLNNKEREKISSEMRLLMGRAHEATKELGWIPWDIFKIDNMLITTDGIRIIDTNGRWPVGITGRKVTSEDMERIYNRSILFWEEFASKLGVDQINS